MNGEFDFRKLLMLASVTLLAACTTATEPLAELSEPERLDAFFEKVFEGRLARDPMQATRLGLRIGYDRWTDRTVAALTESRDLERAWLAELESSFERDGLDPASQLSYDLYVYDARRRIERFDWRSYEYVVEHRSGVQSSAPTFLLNNHRIDNEDDARAYVARLASLDTYFGQIVGRMRIAAAAGVVPPRFVLEKSIPVARNVIAGRPFEAEGPDSILRADFRKKLAAIELGSKARERLLAAADDALLDSVGPAYENLIDYLGLLSQRAGDDDGVWQFPNGDDFYAAELERHTTTDLTADEIHELGLAEVERIHAQMRAIMDEVGFDGTLAEFFEYMRTAPEFYYENTDAGRERYLEEATAVIDAMRDRIDELFGVRPVSDLVVRRVEPFREQSAGKAFYERPSADGTRPGVYYANLYRMERMPTYQLQALAYHEGIPGHHMQIAIQQELTGLPRFRRFGRVTAFSEGWGLYSEWLPTEIDAYQDPYSDFGRLAMELWRACRLVVDTGIHAKRWPRQQAIDYLLEATPNPEGDIINAVERYVVMPGQATAYKIGMIRIQQLRERAERELGDAFDVRRFHDAVLENGPVPLAILDGLIETHIDERRRD